MRILFSCTAGTGHFLPLGPLIEASLAAGHEVAVATSRQHSARVHAFGGGVTSCWVDQPTESDFAMLRDRFGADPDAGRLIGTHMFGQLRPTRALPTIEPFVERWRPDVVVSEGSEFAAGMIAEERGIGFVRVHAGISARSMYERMCGPLLAEIRSARGLPADPEARWLLRVPRISFYPSAFDDDPHPGIHRFRSAPAPAAAERDSTVYITFGTEVVGQPMFAEVAQASIQAAREVGVPAVMSLAHGDPRDLGETSGIRVERWIDQAELLPRVRAVICHAGAGTTLGALAAATPIVAVPFFADQPFNAERIVATQTGAHVPPGPGLADRLESALRAILASEPPGCWPVAEAIAALPDVAEAVGLIEASASATAADLLAR